MTVKELKEKLDKYPEDLRIDLISENGEKQTNLIDVYPDFESSIDGKFVVLLVGLEMN